MCVNDVIQVEFTVLLLSPTDEVKMEGVGQTAQLRAGELIIIVVVLIMWAGEKWTVPTYGSPPHSLAP